VPCDYIGIDETKTQQEDGVVDAEVCRATPPRTAKLVKPTSHRDATKLHKQQPHKINKDFSSISLAF